MAKNLMIFFLELPKSCRICFGPLNRCKEGNTLKVKLDGLPIPKGRLAKDPYFCQDVGTVSHLLLNIWYPLKKPKETQRSASSGSFWM